MVRVWLFGGQAQCAALAGLLQTGADATQRSGRGWSPQQLAGRLLHSGQARTHCSPAAQAGQTADAYAEQEISRVLERFGGVDALVYIADRDDGAAAVEFAIRVASDFLACAREAVRSMAGQGVAGNLVCICDIAGVIGRGGRAAAAAGSAALLGMVRALAKEVGRQGISVNALACGPLAVPGQPAERLSEQEAQLFEAMGVGQPLRPEELAATLALLVRGGHGMTGQVLRLDHGLVI